jgi:hypothetical protein
VLEELRVVAHREMAQMVAILYFVALLQLAAAAVEAAVMLV